MAYFRDEAIALRAIRLGEADRIVSFCTKANGKVRAVAKGVRRPKSRIGSRVEPLSHVEMLCWRGRELDTINQVELVDTFRQIRSDLSRMAPAATMLEMVDQISVERHPAPELFSLLVRALRTLDERASPTLLGAFCFRLLALEGVGPVLDRCASCGATGPLVAFDPGVGGLLCSGCRRGRSVTEATVEYLQLLARGGLARLLDEPAGQASAAFERLGIDAVEHHVGRRLKSAGAAIAAEP